MRVAVYARVSSEEQTERGTIENQIEFATKYCDLHQLEIVEWYKDDGITGTIPLEQRTEGKRLEEDAKKKIFDLLLIYRLDRLGRSARIILNAVYELEQCSVKIRSMTEPFDTGDPNGRFLLTVLAGVADLERETLLERMWYGANRAARAGKWLGGIVPYGYRVNNDGFLDISNDPLSGMDMSEADVIRLIYRLIADQASTTFKVADYLNALGIPPSYTRDGRQIKRGKRKVNTAGIWRPGRIRNMIVNTTYKGIHYYGRRTNKERELIPREYPALVNTETWEKAQQVLRDNQLESMKNSKRQYLLRRLIKCGICGMSYHGTAYGSQRAYYMCNGKSAYKGPNEVKCTSKNVPSEWIENLVWQECVNFIENPGKAITELATGMDIRKSQQATLEAEKHKALVAFNEKETEKQSILDLYRKRIIGNVDVEQQLQRIAQEKKVLEERMRELDQKITNEKTMINKFNKIEDLLTNLRVKLNSEPPFDVRREIVCDLLKEIIIDTKTAENGRLLAVVNARYIFSKVVIRTDKGSYLR